MTIQTLSPISVHVTAKQKTKYILVDEGTNGWKIIERSTGKIYDVLGYGKINRKKYRGTVEYLTDFISTLTREGKEYRHMFWYALHPVD